MVHGKFGQDALTFRSQAQKNFAAVAMGAFPAHVAASFQAVDQFDGAVVLDLHPAGDFANTRAHSIRHALYRQHELILAALQARVFYSLFAEMEKLADLIAELGQSLIIREGELFHSAADVKGFSCVTPKQLYRITIYMVYLRPGGLSHKGAWKPWNLNEGAFGVRGHFPM
jgi:hypothetical protein